MKTINKIALLFFVAILAACSDVDKKASDNNIASDSVIDNGVNTEGLQENTSELASSLVTTCVSCHGENGNSVNTDWPNLAGQQAEYLYQQLLSFRDSKRQSDVMTAALLTGFNDEQLRSIADHYAKMPVIDNKLANNADELPGAHVRARCVSCHGMEGKSVTGLWPNIASQQAGYLAKQLIDYKNGSREHPIMQVIASELTEQQIKDVAEYYSKQ